MFNIHLPVALKIIQLVIMAGFFSLFALSAYSQHCSEDFDYSGFSVTACYAKAVSEYEALHGPILDNYREIINIECLAIVASNFDKVALQEKPHKRFVDSELGQGIGGVTAGTLSALIPGGFLLAPVSQKLGVLEPPSRTFDYFFKSGEVATGLVQIITGVGGEFVGLSLSFTGAGAVTGMPVSVASAGLIAQGFSNISAALLNNHNHFAEMKGNSINTSKTDQKTNSSEHCSSSAKDVAEQLSKETQPKKITPEEIARQRAEFERKLQQMHKNNKKIQQERKRISGYDPNKSYEDKITAKQKVDQGKSSQIMDAVTKGKRPVVPDQ